MKYIKSKLLQKEQGRKKGKYLLTLEVTGYDLEMLEDFATTYAPFQIWEDVKKDKKSMDEFDKLSTNCDYSKKYRNWLLKTWRQFWKGTWNKYCEI
jgi:hypothetical protein